MQDMFFNLYLKKEAERIAKKNNEKFDEEPEAVKREVIELMMEDLEDKYRE